MYLQPSSQHVRMVLMPPKNQGKSKVNVKSSLLMPKDPYFEVSVNTILSLQRTHMYLQPNPHYDRIIRTLLKSSFFLKRRDPSTETSVDSVFSMQSNSTYSNQIQKITKQLHLLVPLNVVLMLLHCMTR